MFPAKIDDYVRPKTVAEALEAAAARKVVTVMPTSEKVEGGRIMHIPAEAGYGVSEVFVDYAGSMPG